MTGSGSSSALAASIGDLPPTVTDIAPQQAEQSVGAERETLSDEERESMARRHGRSMQAWYSAYQHTGNPRHLEQAYRALGLMRMLLAGRSPEYVAKLERERGLA